MSTIKDNILIDVKEQIGISTDVTAFDKQIVSAINTAFMFLKRMGVGPEEGFFITLTGNEQWTDFIEEEGPELEAAKEYVALKAGVIFDPSSSSVLLEAKKDTIKELEWSLNFEMDAMSDNEEV